MTDPERFALNVRNGLLHDLDHLNERCNVDDIILKRYFGSPDWARSWLEDQGRRPMRFCHWCLGG